jgi:hypothetical protein
LQNGFNPDNKGGLVWYTDGSKTDEGTGAGVNEWDSKKAIDSVLGCTHGIPGRNIKAHDNLKHNLIELHILCFMYVGSC